MLGFLLGLLYCNASEWVIHRFVLHGLGRRKGSFFSFHWYDHHRASHRNNMFDPGYDRPVWGFHGQGKEAVLLVGSALLHAPLFPIAPGFTAAVWLSLWNYHRVHKLSHLDPEWARAYLPWHVDHHLGPNQDANWCVTHPLSDHLMGTRVPYVGTALEAERTKRAKAHAERASAARAFSSLPG